MFINKKLAGISTIEILIVLAISSVIFVIAIGTLGQRERIARDDAARRVVGEIAKVRNEAQQGLGPSTTDGEIAVAGNELFGQAIEFVNDEMIVYKLMKNPTSNLVSAYESYSIKLTQQLKWWIDPNASSCTEFNSCYQDGAASPTLANLANDPPALHSGQRLMLVFRNNSGLSYVFSRDVTSVSMTDPAFFAPDANLDNATNYSTDRQRELRVAYAVPGQGADLKTQMANAYVQYYVYFNLSVPNEQRFEVKK